METVFNFFAGEDESEYTLVDNRPALKQKGWGQRRFQQQRQQQQRKEQGAKEQATEQAKGTDRERQRRERQQQKKRKQFGQWRDRQDNRVEYSPSVEIRPDWTVLEQLQLSQLTKVSFEAKGVEDLKACGRLRKFGKAFDRISPRAEKRLRQYDPVPIAPNPTSSDDPYLRQLASSGQAQVFITDSILATLMCATRSVYSWDVVVTRSGNQLWFDKRRHSSFDQLTVHETAQVPIQEGQESINNVEPLSEEATNINACFLAMCLEESESESQYGEEKEVPVSGGQGVYPPKAYRYRRWRLDDSINVAVRSEVDCLVDQRGEEVPALVRAVNEFDPKKTGVDWRKKIETQRGAVLATELKNNANKLAKWTCRALLSDVSILKLGYVSRVSWRSNRQHAIIQTQTYKPRDFASQINLNPGNMWGIFKSIVDICMKKDDGHYLLVKDPNKALLRLYELPPDAHILQGDSPEGEALDAMFGSEEAPGDARAPSE